jgi:hypothetical protein
VRDRRLPVHGVQLHRAHNANPTRAEKQHLKEKAFTGY